MIPSARSLTNTVLATAAVLFGGEIHGATFAWQPSSGNWSAASNWGGATPTVNDTAYVTNSGTATVSVTGATCGTLSLGSGNYSGTVQVSAGALTVPGLIYVAPNSGTSGAITLDGAGSLSSPYETIGYAGTGSFVQSGGSNSSATGILWLGYAGGSSGTYNLTAGLLSQAYEYVAWSGGGSLTQSGGTNSVASTLYLGYGTGSVGTYNLAGGQLSITQSEFVGYNGGGSGVFAQTGGTNTVGSGVTVYSGYYQLGGGLLQGTVGSSLQVANGGLQTAGGTLDLSTFAITITTGTGSLLDLSGNVINASSTSLSVAANSLLILPSASSSSSYASYSNAGLLDILGTTLNVSAGTGFGGWGTVPNRVSCQGSITATPGGWINLGNGLTLSGTGQVSLGSGTLTVNDSTSSAMSAGALTANSMVVGLSGTGSFAQSGGKNTLGRVLILGRNSGDGGTYSLSGGGLLTATAESVGVAGSGSFTQSGGTNSVGTLTLAGTATSVASYNLNGGLLRVSSMSKGSGLAALNDSGGTLQSAASFSGNVPIVLAGGGAVFDTSSNTLTLTAAISGSGSLTKTGTGVLLLSGSDTYSGGTTVLLGKLIVLSRASLQDGSALTVGAGAISKFSSIIPGPLFASGEQPVPEPGATILLACGVATAALCRRRSITGRLKAIARNGRSSR
jgi:autotransporter-associated beta strand protein